MQHFDFEHNIRVLFGEGTLNQLGSLAVDLGARCVLIVTDKGVAAAGILDRAVQAVKKSSLEAHIFDGVQENPTAALVTQATQFAAEAGSIDLVVGLGGGSAMDCAKGVNFLVTNGGSMEDYWGIGKATKPMLPSIGIPTTAGTGSEAQSFALISQDATHQKMACGDKKAQFRTVILDPALLESVPRHVAAATGMDAIAHAVESYVTTRRNAASLMFAREAWRLLEQSFETFLEDPAEPTARGQMLLGAHFAGSAIEHSMLGAAHACANPLTAHYDIPHGVAVSLMLPHVIQFNAQQVASHYAELQLASVRNPIPLHERILELRKFAGLPSQLRRKEGAEFRVRRTDRPANPPTRQPASRPRGVAWKELPRLAEEASQQWTGQFNPRKVSTRELQALYESAY